MTTLRSSSRRVVSHEKKKNDGRAVVNSRPRTGRRDRAPRGRGSRRRGSRRRSPSWAGPRGETRREDREDARTRGPACPDRRRGSGGTRLAERRDGCDFGSARVSAAPRRATSASVIGSRIVLCHSSGLDPLDRWFDRSGRVVRTPRVVRLDRESLGLPMIASSGAARDRFFFTGRTLTRSLSRRRFAEPSFLSTHRGARAGFFRCLSARTGGASAESSGADGGRQTPPTHAFGLVRANARGSNSPRGASRRRAARPRGGGENVGAATNRAGVVFFGASGSGARVS